MTITIMFSLALLVATFWLLSVVQIGYAGTLWRIALAIEKVGDAVARVCGWVAERIVDHAVAAHRRHTAGWDQR